MESDLLCSQSVLLKKESRGNDTVDLLHPSAVEGGVRAKNKYTSHVVRHFGQSWKWSIWYLSICLMVSQSMGQFLRECCRNVYSMWMKRKQLEILFIFIENNLELNGGKHIPQLGMKIEMYNVPFVFIAFISADQRYFWLEALVWKDGLRAGSFPFLFSSVHFRSLIAEKSEENCL